MTFYTESFQENFWSYVRKEFCWRWLGKKGWKDPQTHIDGYRVPARLVAYELVVGKIPAGYGLKRKAICVHGSCVNPEHMELVLSKRGKSIARERVQGVEGDTK